MKLSRGWSAFLVAVGVWSWLIWPRFALAIWRDPRSFADGTPTSFLWVHALLIITSLAIGTAVAVLGVKGFREATASEHRRPARAEERSERRSRADQHRAAEPSRSAPRREDR